MSANVIGGLQFRFYTGDLPYAGALAEPFMRPGYDGYGYHDRGIHGDTGVIVATAAFATVDLRNVFKLLAKDLQGMIIGIWDRDGILWNGFMVLDVKSRTFNVGLDTEGFLYHLECTWRLQSTVTSY